MKLLSVSVGLPRAVEWNGRVVKTSIFKTPVKGAVPVGKLNLNGDEQSDLTVHGGVDKAVYVYPSEHYPVWRREVSDVDFAYAMFGENLTVEGLLETETFIGDKFRIGSAEFVVTQPRMPCFKLGIRFGRPDMIKRLLASRRTGFYLAVLNEGEVSSGDSIERIGREDHGISVTDITDLYVNHDKSRELLRRASTLASLPASWREYFRQRIG
jgi:MOSC domain-containing protein YiiM